MGVGLLIVTHERIAAAIVDTAASMIGPCPLPLGVLPVPGDCNPDEMRSRAATLIEGLDAGQGVLILADIFGSTPANIAGTLVEKERVTLVSGINLPMLVRVMNYPRLGLAELAEKAVSGGRDGVVLSNGLSND